MATRFAISSSGWSTGSTWNGFYELGFPNGDDDVYTNSYTVNMDTSVAVKSLNNSTTPLIVDNIATPPMTSNATPSGFVFASSFNTGQEPFRAFDQTTGTLWQSGVTTAPHTITYQFPTAKNIKRYAIKTAATAVSTPRQWTLEASNDNITYTVLERVTSSLSVNSNYTSAVLANTSSFTFYRVNISSTATGGNFLQIADIELTESTGSGAGNLSGGSFNFNTPNVSASLSTTTLNQNSNTPNLITVTATTGTVNISAPNAIISQPLGNLQSPCISHTGNCDFNLTVTRLVATSNGTFVLSKSSNGTVTVVGDLIGGVAAANATAAIVSTAGNTVVIGNLTGGTAGASFNPAISQNAGTIQVIGNVIGGITSNAITFTGVSATITGSIIGGTGGAGIASTTGITLDVSGSVTGGTGVAAISLTGASTLTVNGTVTGGSGAVGISSTSTSATNRLTGPFITGPTGIQPFYGPKLTIITGSATYWTFTSPNVAINKTLYSTDLVSGVPSPSDVRQGVTYASGALTGTMIVPSTSSVAFGVPVDTFTGSAIIVGSNYNVSNEIWNTPVTSLTGSSTIGERLKNNATVASTGAQIAAMAGL